VPVLGIRRKRGAGKHKKELKSPAWPELPHGKKKIRTSSSLRNPRPQNIPRRGRKNGKRWTKFVTKWRLGHHRMKTTFSSKKTHFLGGVLGRKQQKTYTERWKGRKCRRV